MAIIGQRFKLPIGLTLGYREGERGSFYLVEITKETLTTVVRAKNGEKVRLRSDNGGYFIINRAVLESGEPPIIGVGRIERILTQGQAIEKGGVE